MTNAIDPRDRIHAIDKMSESEKSYVAMDARQAADQIWDMKGGAKRPEYLKLIGQYLAAKADQEIAKRSSKGGKANV